MENSYDLLAWWRKVLLSCETEDQFKNALNLWPKIIKLTPCVDDAWREVINAAKNKLNRLVPPPRTWLKGSYIYPESKAEIISHVFGCSMPKCKPPKDN